MTVFRIGDARLQPEQTAVQFLEGEQLIKGAQGCFMALAGHPVRFTPRQRSGARCQFSGQPGVTGEFQGDWLKGCRVEGFFVYCQ